MYRQTTYETCLAVALMLLIEAKPSKLREIAVWKSGWVFNFLIGQINYISKKYHKAFSIYVENKKYLSTLKQQALISVTLIRAKIDAELIKRKLNDGPIIVYLDNYFLQKLVHAPHSVLIHSARSKDYKVLDPWDGKVKIINKRCLHHAIDSLRKHLKFSTVLIAKTIS